MSGTRREDGQVAVMAALVLGGFLVVLALGALGLAEAYGRRAAFQSAVDAAAVAAAETAEPLVSLSVRVHEVLWTPLEDQGVCTRWVVEEGGGRVCVAHPVRWVPSDGPEEVVAVVGPVSALFAGDPPGWAASAGCDAVGADPAGPPDETRRVCDGWTRSGPVRWRYPDPRRTEATLLAALRARDPGAELRALDLAPCGSGDACTGRVGVEAETRGVGLFGRPARLVVRASAAPKALRMPDSWP